MAFFFHPFSCKWVGLFVILWAGITTVLNLWDLLGDLSLSLVSSAKFLNKIHVTIILVNIIYSSQIVII